MNLELCPGSSLQVGWNLLGGLSEFGTVSRVKPASGMELVPFHFPFPPFPFPLPPRRRGRWLANCVCGRNW